MIQRFKGQSEPYNLAECCQALGVSRSGWYAQKAKNSGTRSQQDALLSRELRRSFLDSRKTYGCRRLQKLLHQQGFRCGKNRINRLMQQLGLRAIQKRRFRPQTTQSRHNEPIAPNRLKERLEEPTGPHEVWLADITYLPTLNQGWLYLAVEMDLYSRSIVGWKLGSCLAAPLAIEAFQRAVKAWAIAPQIHHSDRGVQYAASTFRQLLKTYGVCSSMSRRANPYDNAVMESFFATLKTECFQQLVPLDQAQAQRLLFDYIESFYNPKRLHSALAYRAPLDVQAAAGHHELLAAIAGEERAQRNQSQKSVTPQREAKAAQGRNGLNGGDPASLLDGAQAVYAGFDLETFWRRAAQRPDNSLPNLSFQQQPSKTNP